MSAWFFSARGNFLDAVLLKFISLFFLLLLLHVYLWGFSIDHNVISTTTHRYFHSSPAVCKVFVFPHPYISPLIFFGTLAHFCTLKTEKKMRRKGDAKIIQKVFQFKPAGASFIFKFNKWVKFFSSPFFKFRPIKFFRIRSIFYLCYSLATTDTRSRLSAPSSFDYDGCIVLSYNILYLYSTQIVRANKLNN